MLRPILFILLISLSACEGCFRGSQDTVDITDVELELQIGRLDQQLFHSHPDSLQKASDEAYAQHGGFYKIYVEDILQGMPVDDPRLPVFLHRFVTDTDWSAVQEGIDSVFSDMEVEREAFELAFRRLKALFPDSITPAVIAFNSGFNYGIFPTDSVLGVGLEWFIGTDHPVIGVLAPDAFPAYVKARMRPEMLVPSAIKGWLLVHYMRDVRGADVLTNLVETGKVMALLDVLLPETPAHLKFAFTTEQLAWAEANEFNIWKDLVSKDQLYSKKTQDIGRLMNDGPFTSGLPRESPGHIGEWIGYRMVRSYMEEGPKTTYAQLFEIEDPRVILKHYKPR